MCFLLFSIYTARKIYCQNIACFVKHILVPQEPSLGVAVIVGNYERLWSPMYNISFTRRNQRGSGDELETTQAPAGVFLANSVIYLSSCSIPYKQIYWHWFWFGDCIMITKLTYTIIDPFVLQACMGFSTYSTHLKFRQRCFLSKPPNIMFAAYTVLTWVQYTSIFLGNSPSTFAKEHISVHDKVGR